MDTTMMMALLAAVVCLSLVLGGGYYYYTSGKSGGSSSPPSSAGDGLLPDGGGSGGGSASPPQEGGSTIDVLRAGSYGDKTFLFLRGEPSSGTPFVTQQSPSRVQVQKGTCGTGQVAIQNMDTRRWLVPGPDRSVQWTPEVSTPYGCWAETSDPACPGTGKVYESVRFPTYRLRRGTPPDNGGNTRVLLGSPAEYDTARTKDFKGFCWTSDKVANATA